ncbi:unnamed protein product, partial [Fusarium graminearum]
PSRPPGLLVVLVVILLLVVLPLLHPLQLPAAPGHGQRREREGIPAKARHHELGHLGPGDALEARHCAWSQAIPGLDLQHSQPQGEVLLDSS